MRLLAWIEHPPDTTDCIGAFIAAGTTREPAWGRFATEREARAWVEAEAAALRVPVSWGVKAPDQP